MLKQCPAFVLPAPEGILSGRQRGEGLLAQLSDHLRSGSPDSVTPLDFSQVSFIDISSADECLVKLLLRIGSGEIGSRYVFVRNANESVRETLDAVLKLRTMAALCETGEGVRMLGKLKTPIREALDVMLEKKQGTSSEIAEALGKNINIACNRLNTLQRMGLVCRTKDASVEGGGRQFIYESIL
jgi:hypothetical protein